MLRTHWITDAAAAKAYYQASDYYAQTQGDWLGEGAKALGLVGPARREDFEQLCDNLNPLTGEPLTTYTRDGRRVGIDLNFNSTKSVGIARELAGPDNRGDERIEAVHREAVAYAMGFVEADMRGRVRVGGKNEDRITGNMVAFRVTHRDTRISGQDGLPDMSLHDHVVLMNATHDPVEGKWKAAEIAQVKHDAPYYEAIYHNRLASNLRELGYGIRKKDKAFEIEGISDELVRKFSRRRAYIEKVADKLGIATPEGMSKLGATTRLGKVKEQADDLNAYWVSRLTDKERQQLAGLNGKPGFEGDERAAVEFAIGHLFERKSVVDARRLFETALRHGMGSVTPESVQEEAKRQGVLLKDGEATTRQVLAEEGRVIAFARDGRGTCGRLGARPGSQVEAGAPLELGRVAAGDAVAAPDTPSTQWQRSSSETATSTSRRQAVSSDHVRDATNMVDLSPEQAAIARHVWDSPDRVILIRGAAGTGKTHTMKATIEGIDRPVVVLAPSAEASRGVLRKEGFKEADTVARFLIDEKYQEQARDGVIWVDEAGLLGMRQVREVFDAAERLNARVVLQGDRRQHGSVERGATLRVLEEFAGLPVAELRDIRRQKGRYKQAVASLAKGDLVGGYDLLDGLGWVRESRSNAPLVDDYLAALDARKSVLVVAPTHVEGGEITGEIRGRLKERGMIAQEGRQVDVLVPLGWTEAERADLERYEGTEVMVFHRSSGTFKAGDRVSGWKPGDRFAKASHFSVYTPASIELAAGDMVRITANGKTKDGGHKLNNGAIYRVKGFTKDEDIVLDNGWVVDRTFGHLAHGYVTTSHASQGKTVDRVLIAMGHESRPAINAEQFYVSVSRGREQAMVYSDLPPGDLREAIQKADPRKSATELLGQQRAKPKPRKKDRLRKLTEKMRTAFKQLREKAADAIAVQRERERGYAR